MRLLYNSRAGPLAWLDPAQGHAPPRLTFGFNNWQLPGGERVEMAPAAAPAASAGAAAGAADGAGGLWWAADVEIPEMAAALSFCVSGGEDAWDNNSGRDHKVAVEPPARFGAEADPVAAWLDSLVPPLRDAARARREAAEAEAAAKAAKRQAEREALRANALGVLRKQVWAIYIEGEVAVRCVFLHVTAAGKSTEFTLQPPSHTLHMYSPSTHHHHPWPPPSHITHHHTSPSHHHHTTIT